MITADSKNIVIADDTDFHRVQLSQILTDIGHYVNKFSNGQELISFLTSSSDAVDLMILDIQAPGVDGLAVLEWIKEKGLVGRIPVVIISGIYELEKVRVQTKEYGVKWVITKAVTPERIAFLVNGLLFTDKVGGRNSLRVPTYINAKLTIEEVANGHILNVSETGIYLRTSRHLHKGTAVCVRFSLPGYGDIFDMKGIVVRSVRAEGGGGLFEGVGVEFTRPFPENHKLLCDYIEKEGSKIG
jgi:CheY-like chemotaxis protein